MSQTPGSPQGSGPSRDERDERDEDQGPTGPVIRDKRRIDPETGEVRRPEQTGHASTTQQEAHVADSTPNNGDYNADQQDQATNKPPEDAQDAPEQAADVAPDTEEPVADPIEQAGEVLEQAEESDIPTDAQLAADRLEDLRRLQAEYVNYKRRVDRDRERDREGAIGSVVEALLPVMDDIHSAREHGDLTDGPLAAIADKVETTLGKFGVERFGAPGEVFDPNLHEALMHVPDAQLPEGTTETTIVQVMQPGFKVGERLVRAARVSVADPS